MAQEVRLPSLGALQRLKDEQDFDRRVQHQFAGLPVAHEVRTRYAEVPAELPKSTSSYHREEPANGHMQRQPEWPASPAQSGQPSIPAPKVTVVWPFCAEHPQVSWGCIASCQPQKVLPMTGAAAATATAAPAAAPAAAGPGLHQARGCHLAILVHGHLVSHLLLRPAALVAHPAHRDTAVHWRRPDRDREGCARAGMPSCVLPLASRLHPITS